MNRWIRVFAAVAFAAGVLASTPGHAQETLVTISVKIRGLKGQDGVALVTLFDSDATWMKIPKAVQVVKTQITAESMSIQFKDVRPGTYGVSVVHDANKNGEMDMRWFPWPQPKEGAAASNDAGAKVGPPTWDGAKFTVAKANVTVTATMMYFD